MLGGLRLVESESITKIVLLRTMKRLALILISALTLMASSAKAQESCPAIDSLFDLTCDGTLKIAIIGDSFVKGVGDSPMDRGGYVARLAESFPNASLVNLGVPGITSEQLYRNYKTMFDRGSHGSTWTALQHADIVIIDVGRNDYWAQNPAAEVARNVKRLVRLIRVHLAEDPNYPAPAFGVTRLAPTNRSFQRGFINAVNQEFLKLKSSTFPVEVRADTMNPKHLRRDGLHPSSRGYDDLVLIFADWITGQAQTQCQTLRTAFLGRNPV